MLKALCLASPLFPARPHQPELHQLHWKWSRPARAELLPGARSYTEEGWGSSSYARLCLYIADRRYRPGLNCDGRLFISDRTHLVFDFHQIVDGLKEVELGGKSIGTTKKGIGPTYSSKASRSGLRVHHLIYDFDNFATKFRKLVEGRFKRYGHFEYDTEGEIERYKVRSASNPPWSQC